MCVTKLRLFVCGAIAALACTGVSEPVENVGALQVSVTVRGMPASSDSHTVIVTVSGQRELQRRVLPHSGGSVLISDLPTGPHSVSLESPTACWRTLSDEGSITIVRGRTSRIGFTVYCSGPPQVALVRTSSPPGGISERYVLEPDGAFRLQTLDGYVGFHEYVGIYSREDSLYHFAFDANAGEWGATGTMSDECLSVVYNADMVLSDFVDGTYCSTASQTGPGAWLSLQPMPGARWQVGAASLNGIVYVAGGVFDDGTGWVAPAKILAYDPARDTWRTAGGLIAPVRAPALAVVGDRIYVVGGCHDDPWEPIADLQIFDPATGTTVAGPPMSHGRCGLAVAVLDRRIHAIGGVYKWEPNDWEGEWDSSHEVFDPSTGAWSDLAPLPRARGGHGAVAIDGKIYVAGGMGDTLQVYEPSTDSWTKSGSPPARFGVAATALGADAYFFGGGEYQTTCCRGPIPSSTVDRFDPGSGIWAQVAPMPTARTGHAAAVVDGTVYVVGGSSSGAATGALSVLERFTPR